MEKRYARNRNTISEEENRQLKNSKVCVAGCGGIGGGLIESLVRDNLSADIIDLPELPLQSRP